MLDGSIARDVGFDPLGFAKSEKGIMSYRKVEIEHTRLAMLAAEKWPISELYYKKISNMLSLTPLL